VTEHTNAPNGIRREHGYSMIELLVSLAKQMMRRLQQSSDHDAQEDADNRALRILTMIKPARPSARVVRKPNKPTMSRPQTTREESLAGGALVNPEMTVKETTRLPTLPPTRTTQTGIKRIPAVVAADNAKLIMPKELKEIMPMISKSAAQELSAKNQCKWWSISPIVIFTCAICHGKSRMRSSSNCFHNVEQLLVQPLP